MENNGKFNMSRSFSLSFKKRKEIEKRRRKKNRNRKAPSRSVEMCGLLILFALLRICI